MKRLEELPIAALSRALVRGVPFPLPDRPMNIEEMDALAARRVELVVDLQSRIMDGYNEARLGTVMEVLCEGFDPLMGSYAGRTYADSVEVDGRVCFTAAGVVPAGTFVNVRMTDTVDGDLQGEVEE